MFNQIQRDKTWFWIGLIDRFGWAGSVFKFIFQMPFDLNLRKFEKNKTNQQK